MWIKKRTAMLNLERFDGLMIDRENPTRIVLMQANPKIKKIPLAEYDETTAVGVMEEIARAMQNGDTLYVMP